LTFSVKENGETEILENVTTSLTAGQSGTIEASNLDANKKYLVDFSNADGVLGVYAVKLTVTPAPALTTETIVLAGKDGTKEEKEAKECDRASEEGNVNAHISAIDAFNSTKGIQFANETTFKLTAPKNITKVAVEIGGSSSVSAASWLIDNATWAPAFEFKNFTHTYYALSDSKEFTFKASLGAGTFYVTNITVSYGDISTGIETLKAAKGAKDGAIYNLAGQKVSKDFKGLIIRDGKKMIQK
jgi:hypothetical protein